MADNHTERNLKIAFVINFMFTIIEIIGGLYTNSIAILSDAVHDLGDSFSLGVSAILERISNKEPDKKYTYGYERFSLLGALISGLVLFGGTIFILTETIPRLWNPEEVDPLGMLFFAIGGILFNGLAFWKLHHGNSIHEKTVSLHLLEDFFGWIAILIGSIILFFYDVYIIDAILSVGISIYILFHVYRNVKEVFAILLQKVPSQIDIESLETSLEEIKGLLKAYHCHIWTLEGQQHMMSIHIVIEDNLSVKKMKEIKDSVRDIACDYGIEHTTIECEFSRYKEE